MLGLISLRFFAQSGHIDAFRSIVGEAPEAGIESAKLAMRIADEHRSSAREPGDSEPNRLGPKGISRKP